MKSIYLFVVVAFVFSGCFSSNRLDVSSYQKSITEKLDVPNECKNLYTKGKSKVAVVNFTNNSNLSSAKVNDKQSSKDFNIGMNIIGVNAGLKTTNSTTSRLVDPKLASSFIPIIENMLRQTGGVELFERADYDKVDAELKFQDSGLLDPNSVVEFGQTSGVRYIVTGSIDYVSHNFNNYSKNTEKLANATKKSNNTNLKLATAAVNLATSFFDGTTIKAGITVKVIDVATGKIVFTKQLENETKLNQEKEPTYSELVGAVKENIVESLPLLKEQFNSHFTVNGYITKIKGNGSSKIVQISLGSDDAVNMEDKFLVYTLDASIDPLKGTISCETIATNIKLEVSKNISKNNSWANVIDGDEDRLKLLQIVKRIKE